MDVLVSFRFFPMLIDPLPSKMLNLTKLISMTGEELVLGITKQSQAILLFRIKPSFFFILVCAD